MDMMVQELKKIMPFKDSTAPGDLILVAIERNKSVFYALVTDIVRDESRRDEWWHVTMQVLGVPPQEVVWTLREPQFTGQETFTMDGDGRFMQALNLAAKRPASRPPAADQRPASSRPRPLLKRIK